MAYRLKKSETVEAGLHRTAREQLERAASELTDLDLDAVEAVHQARKRFKKLRALLRLVRPTLGEATFKQYNRLFRDLGRELAQTRDADVLLETLDELDEHLNATGETVDLSGLRQWFSGQRDQTDETSAQNLQTRMAAIATQLRTVAERIDDWILDSKGFNALAPGLQQIYSEGRTAMESATRSPSDANYHEWRKRVKDHWYHSRLLRSAWPRLMKAHAKEMKRLADLLGDDHDLAVFRQALTDVPRDCLTPEAGETLLRLIIERQRTLRKQARGLGERVYAEKPKRFRKRIQAWWKAGNKGVD